MNTTTNHTTESNPGDLTLAGVDPQSEFPSRNERAASIQLHLDVPITRRKNYHVVLSDSEGVLFRSMFVSECLAFIANEGIDAYQLVPHPQRLLQIKELGDLIVEQLPWQN